MRDIASYDCAWLANTELCQEGKTFFINDSVRGLEFAPIRAGIRRGQHAFASEAIIFFIYLNIEDS
jgi:hypothetical protein